VPGRRGAVLAELASRDVVPLTIVPECFVGVTSFDFMFPISDAPLGVVRSWTRLEDATRALMSRTTCRAGNRVEDQAGPRAARIESRGAGDRSSYFLSRPLRRLLVTVLVTVVVVLVTVVTRLVTGFVTVGTTV